MKRYSDRGLLLVILLIIALGAIPSSSSASNTLDPPYIHSSTPGLHIKSFRAYEDPESYSYLHILTFTKQLWPS